MKQITLFLILFVFFSCAVAQTPQPIVCKIVGGAGITKTTCNPNFLPSMQRIDERLYSAFVRDTLTQKFYRYDRTQAEGQRWIEVKFDTTPPSVFDTTRILWNGGNYDVGGITVGTKQSAPINFITDNVLRGKWTNIGLAIGAPSPFGNALYVNGTTSLGNLQLRTILPATDFTQIILRNPNDQYLYVAPSTQFLEASYLQNLDTVTAWAGRVVNLTNTTHDVVINNRKGIQSVYDSIVFNLEFKPLRNQEINIWVSGNARLWAMDIILKCPYTADTNYSLLEEGNGLNTAFQYNQTQQCFEFGLEANNPNYQGEYLSVQQATVFKLSLKYDSKSRRWMITRHYRQG
jgi:hypothetical protein